MTWALPLALSDAVRDWLDLGLRWLHVIAAMAWIGIADVFEARIASGPTIRSSSAKTSRFGSSSSTIASITRSQSARSARSVVVVSRPTAAALSSSVSRPFSTPRVR